MLSGLWVIVYSFAGKLATCKSQNILRVGGQRSVSCLWAVWKKQERERKINTGANVSQGVGLGGGPVMNSEWGQPKHDGKHVVICVLSEDDSQAQ